MTTLRRCRNNIVADNIVPIDVDTYNFNNVIVIDVPESHTKKREIRPSKKTYIYIDDDESPSSNHENVDTERKNENGASSSRMSPDTHFSQENISPVKLSKGKRTYSNNRFGLNIQSDSDSSDDDDADCEFMEDSTGQLKEEWERAFLKRKGHLHNHRMEKGESSVVDDNQQHKDDEEKDESCVPDDEDQQINEHEESLSDENNDEIETNDDVTVAMIDEDAPVENSIIDQREKLKETDEYKRAQEEEFLARQLALKIQAEEAQQLRRVQKRKKAETLRLLDMERRQKQRVEEIRETQKKDEENMNLKEQYRTEVQAELKRLEFMCLDMASLLRGLGIKVGDGFSPSKNEVRVAYKKALLSFHPDRASGSDMRQQVEAEEKFKLISRMKEKFSL